MSAPRNRRFPFHVPVGSPDRGQPGFGGNALTVRAAPLRPACWGFGDGARVGDIDKPDRRARPSFASQAPGIACKDIQGEGEQTNTFHARSFSLLEGYQTAHGLLRTMPAPVLQPKAAAN